MTTATGRYPVPAFQVYACQAGYAPWTALSQGQQAEIRAQAGDSIDVRSLWWKRVRGEAGWCWEPLQVREGNC